MFKVIEWDWVNCELIVIFNSSSRKYFVNEILPILTHKFNQEKHINWINNNIDVLCKKKLLLYTKELHISLNKMVALQNGRQQKKMKTYQTNEIQYRFKW